MEKRQRRIKQLVEDMPATLKAAQEAGAAAAQIAKAHQTEMPSPEKVLLALLPCLELRSITLSAQGIVLHSTLRHLSSLCNTDCSMQSIQCRPRQANCIYKCKGGFAQVHDVNRAQCCTHYNAARGRLLPGSPLKTALSRHKHDLAPLMTMLTGQVVT